MKKLKKKVVAKRKPPKLVDTAELCKDLVAMAGLLGNSRIGQKIYKAVRQLQLLDKLAIKAGILPK